jgi:hypothetical protein
MGGLVNPPPSAAVNRTWKQYRAARNRVAPATNEVAFSSRMGGPFGGNGVLGTGATWNQNAVKFKPIDCEAFNTKIPGGE